MTVLVYLAIAALVFAGLSALGRRRSMTREEYESRKGQSGGGNALLRGAGAGLLELQGLLEPGRQQVRKVQEEDREEDDGSGDPPEPGRRPPARRRSGS